MNLNIESNNNKNHNPSNIIVNLPIYDGETIKLLFFSRIQGINKFSTFYCRNIFED